MVNARPGAAWCLNKAYGFSSERESLVATAARYSHRFDYAGSGSEIPIFKMHGSINWVFKHRDKHPPADLVSREREFFVLENQRLPLVSLTYRTKSTGRPWYLSPLIVPPVYEKHGLIRRHLHEVWDGASAALQAADRVVFWGYSFPRADTHARHYFQGLAQTNSALRDPVLVNPDPGAAAALWHVMRPQRLTHYRSAAELLALSKEP